MSYWQCMLHIILPQAFRRMLPALGNNAIAIWLFCKIIQQSA